MKQRIQILHRRFNLLKIFNSEKALKPVPRDNPAFVNIILKSDKTSQYINDLNEFIPMLENIVDIIDDEENVQVFNAKVYYFNKSADYFKDKYDKNLKVILHLIKKF